MNHIQTETNELPSDSLAVEFYPSVEDYVHIAERMNEAIPTPQVIQYTYHAFLVINAIVFPAFLLFNEYYVIGILVLALNIAAISWLIPWSIRSAPRDYYKRVVGPRENEVARVELTSEGIRYTADEGESFLPWRRITAIEETDDAILFYFLGNGFAVRKSGFAYRGQQDDFARFARSQLAHYQQLNLER